MTADATYYGGVVQIRQDGNQYIPSGKVLEVESGGHVSQPVDVLTATSTTPNHGYTVCSSSVAATITVATPTRAGLEKTVVVYNSGSTSVDITVDFTVPVVGVTTVYTNHIATFDEDGSLTVVAISTALWGLKSIHTTDAAIAWSS